MTATVPSGSAPHPGTPALPAAVLFDMDGLLFDTEPLWFSVESDLVAELGGAWSKSDHAILVGSSLPVSSAFISERCGRRVSPSDVADLLLTRMAAALREAPPLRPGVARLLAELESVGMPRALVSSTARHLIDAALEGLPGLSFDVVVAGDAVSNNKPHPEPYLTAAALLDVDPGDCLALEDSPTGVASAGAAGCFVVAVPSVVPIEPAERRVVVPSLEQVDLAFIASLFADRVS